MPQQRSSQPHRALHPLRRRFAPLLALLLLALPDSAFATLQAISLDGDFADWSSMEPAAIDPRGDGEPIDFGRLWVANDQDWLYLRFECGARVEPDAGQDLRLWIDTDNDPATGKKHEGLGAELVWEFGKRTGTFYTPRPVTLDPADLHLRIGPTHGSDQFEVALRRDRRPARDLPLFPGPTVRILLSSGRLGDQVPDRPGGLLYTFAPGTIPIAPIDFTRATPGVVRLAGYNIQHDGLFKKKEAPRQEALQRILRAINADIWILNEVWNHRAEAVAKRFEQLLPSPPGGAWHAVRRDRGNVIVSRFPIKQSWAILPQHRLSAALIDLGPEREQDLLVVANHWRCCKAEDERRKEAQALVAWLADANTPGGTLTLPAATPIVLGGDLNLVGSGAPLRTLLGGEINAVPAPDRGDPTPSNRRLLSLLVSRHSDARMGYTWRKESARYYPGVLDYILYTSDRVTVAKHFILDTRTMSPARLTITGLRRNDTVLASDHDPRVVDLLFQPR